MSRHSSASAFHKSKTLNDKYMLGDEIGKGAYGRVYKGLDLENGDFVAIKQVSLENIPPEDLASIMSEIDLLKNLNHKNIVKYQGSFKTRTHLYIILEFVENGSLANNIKPNKFGALPENVVGRYIGQVLEGLVYLHEQGVIHRDIKGANILTTKEGEVKLADFGVATKLTEADINTHSVVGTPYWMAPEVIEMSGVSAASDIWSVGCTVIELLTCVPPYYDLQPMPALFRIVQDDHPPLPEHISGVIIDFLKQCFRKDAKLRPDAQTLLDHAWIRKSRKEKSNGKNGVIRDIPRDLSTSAHAVIKENKIQGIGPPSEDGHATRDPFESGSDDDLKCNGHSPTTSYEASSTRSNSVGNRAPLRIPSHGIAHFQRLPGSHEQEYLDTLTTKLAPTPTLTPLTRPPISTRASESPDSIGFNQELHRMLHDGSRQGGAEEQLRREIGQECGTTEKLPLLLQDEEDGEVNGPLEVPEIQVQRKGNQLVKAVTNVPDSPLQGGKSSFVHLRKLSDTPGDGSLKDILDDPFIRSHEATTSASIGHGLPPRSASALDAHVLSAKLKAKMVQKRVEVEGLSTPKKDGDEIFSSMIDVVDDDDFGRPGLGLMNRREGRDYLAKQALEVNRLMALLKPDEIEEVVLMTCQKLTSIFQGFPDKKQQLIKPHGFIPLMDLLDVNNNRVVYAALQVLNEITHDNVDLLESACHVGLIPLMMGFASPECSREMRMQAAYFVQQLCHNSSLTLQMFIACRGLPVLVSFLEPDYAKYREMVHKAIDGMWQVFELRSSTARNDFCRIFAKSGVLVRLVNTLHNLNEATRVPSTSSTVDKPSNKLESSNERLTLKTRSGPIEQSRTATTEHFKPRSGQLDQTRARSTHVDYHRTVAGLNAVDSSRIPPGQAHRPSALPNYLWQSFPGQVETSGQYSGQLNPSRVATSSEHLRHSDPFQQGLGESTWTLGGESGRDDEVRSDGEQRPLLSDEHWGSNDPTSRGLHALPDQAQHDQAGFYFMMNEKPSTFFEKDVYVKPVSGPLDQMRQLPDRETALPLLHHSGALRRMNGDFDSVMVGLTDHEKQNGAIEMGHLPPPKFAWLGTGNTSPSGKLSPSTSARMNPKLSGALSITAEPVTTLSGLASQTASGLLSVSGVLHARQGSATSSGLLSRMHSSLNPDEAREYVAKVADLLLEFSRADTIVKSHMCSISLLIRLLQMLNKLEAPILVKVLMCIKQLSQDPYTLEYLQRADAMKHLVPFLEAREGPYVSQIHNQVLNALHNLCKINKRRQEQAAESGIIPHLIHFIRTDSPLKQYALPLLCDMAHASRYTREQLRSRGGLEVYLGLLDDEYWAVTALDSLAVCLAHDNDQRKVEQTLLRKEALHKLVTFFASCEGPSSVHILEPFLKIIMKSVRLNTALAVSGLTPLLVARLDHQDAIARLTLLKLIRAVYEHHPRPKQLIVEHELPAKLQRLIEERRDGERSGGQVLVKQMAFSLLKALHINTVL